MPKVETRKLAGGTTRYFVRYTHPETRKQTSRPFDTKREAQGFATDVKRLGIHRVLAELDTDESTSPTLDEWAASHIAALTRITPGSRKQYASIYRRVWSPRLGTYRVDQLTRTLIAMALNDYASTIIGTGEEAHPIADKTVESAYTLLATMMKAAVRDELIRKTPCADISVPRSSAHLRTRHRILSRDEFKRIYDELHPHYRPLFVFLVGTGARWGEATVLEAGDIDFAEGKAHIFKARQRDPSKALGPIGPTKTAMSTRVIDLDPVVLTSLREQCVGRGQSDLIFTSQKGTPIDNQWAWKIWRKAVDAAGVMPRPRIHDLRHTHVAWMTASGYGLDVVRVRLGHESITTTINTYNDLLPGRQRSAAVAAMKPLGDMLAAVPIEQ